MMELVNLGVGVFTEHDKKIKRICSTLRNQVRINRNLDRRITMLAVAMTAYILATEISHRELKERIEKLEHKKED